MYEGTDRLTTEQEQKVKNLRTKAPGYIGGRELVDKATDKQILELSDLQDEHAKLSNQLRENQRQQANIIASIKSNI